MEFRALGDALPVTVVAALDAAGWARPSVRAAPAPVTIVFSRKARLPAVPDTGERWIWLCAERVEDSLVRQAVLAGAYDVLALADSGQLARLVLRLTELLAQEPPAKLPSNAIFGGPASRRTLERISRAARTSMPVLITGETGTGKEVAAHLLHTWSSRRAKAFVPINCAAIPNELMEGELFGYAKGAFSGAVRAYDGALMAAAGGTVFLDEVDDTPHATQVKLLRVLEDRVVTRLGEATPHQVDFRIVAATNEDLKALIREGRFGADFYERLAIVSIALPALRERLEDLPALVAHFIARYQAEEPNARTRETPKAAGPAALRALAAYPWPGNIRELRNVIFEALVYKRAGDELLLSDLPRRIVQRTPDTGSDGSTLGSADEARIKQAMAAQEFNLREAQDRLARTALRCALEASGGNAARAAKLLGEVGRGTSSDPGGTVRAMMRRLL